MSVSNFLNSTGVSYLWNKIKNTFQQKEESKGLSTNDFTDELKTKLDGVEAGAKVNVQSNWNESNSNSDAYILNKPTIPSTYSQLTDDLGLVKNSEIDDILSKKVAKLIEIVIDSSKYDQIINSNDGLINKLNESEAANQNIKVNITKTDFETRGNDIKFIRLTNSDGTRTTLFNIVFCMPLSGVFCGYNFNKLDGTHIGIGYATIRYDSETTVKIGAIRSTMIYS